MKKKPTIILGALHCDERGSLLYNNDFDTSYVKRIYLIQNASTLVNRGWQGHKIEQRWFSAVNGSFKVSLILIDNWENPNKLLKPLEFVLKSDTLDVLFIPKGFVSSIKAIEDTSKLLVMADYLLGEIKDEYKFPHNYFEKI